MTLPIANGHLVGFSIPRHRLYSREYKDQADFIEISCFNFVSSWFSIQKQNAPQTARKTFTFGVFLVKSTTLLNGYKH